MIKFIKNIFKKEIPRGKTYHMQDHQGWGDSVRWTDWPKMKVHGHLCIMPNVGDILTCNFTSGVTHEFQFTNVEYCRDPSDMFFANVKHLGELTSSDNEVMK